MTRPIAALAALTYLPSDVMAAANAIIALINANVPVINGVSGVPLGMNATIFNSSVAATTTAAATEQVLQTYSLPANALANIGDCLQIRAGGSFAANGNTKTVKLYFGAGVIASPAAASNGTNWFLELNVWRRSAATQGVVGSGVVALTPVTIYDTAATEDLTAAITIKAAGVNGSAAADITCDFMQVRLLQAP